MCADLANQLTEDSMKPTGMTFHISDPTGPYERGISIGASVFFEAEEFMEEVRRFMIKRLKEIGSLAGKEFEAL